MSCHRQCRQDLFLSNYAGVSPNDWGGAGPPGSLMANEAGATMLDSHDLRRRMARRI
ncbi:hypothetical protein IVB27_34010 [Bradyrhizobium sp. 197]|nr:hypothetical protein [Bradyrhizobium sp. 197]MCK1518852.1 hypothetical protein [Bradyrhizobium sp. 17]